MANSIPKEQIVADAALIKIKSKLVAAKLVSQDFTEEVAQPNKKIFVDRPPRLAWRSGSTYSQQDINVGQVEVKLDTQGGVDFGWSSFEGVTNVKDALRNDLLDESTTVIASKIDNLVINTLVNNSPNMVGTGGSAIDSYAKYSAGALRLEQMLVPNEHMSSILHSSDAQALVNSFGNHASLETEAREAIKMNKIPMIASTPAYRSNNAGTYTVGDYAGTPLVNGADQAVLYRNVKDTMTSTLVTDGWTSGKYPKVGDRITIAGVYAINERTGASLGFLKQFNVRASSGSGVNCTLTLYPALIPWTSNVNDQQFANVTAAPADNAAISVVGAANLVINQNIMFHKRAATLVVRKLEKPVTGLCYFSTDKETGLTIRIWRNSDFVNDTHGTRIDILAGVTSLQGELSTVLGG